MNEDLDTLKHPQIHLPDEIMEIVYSDEIILKLKNKPVNPNYKEWDIIGIAVGLSLISLSLLFFNYDIANYLIQLIFIIIGIFSFLTGLGYTQNSIKINKALKNEFEAKKSEIDKINSGLIWEKKVFTSENKAHLVKKGQIADILREFNNPHLKLFPTSNKTRCFFIFFLDYFFTSRIKSYMGIRQDDYSFIYTPDYIFIKRNCCFAINIIDEMTSSDYKTENTHIALENNWGEINFTRSQIQNFPIECCYLIAKMVFSIYGGNNIFEKFEPLNFNLSNLDSKNITSFNEEHFDVYAALEQYEFLKVKNGDILVFKTGINSNKLFNQISPIEIYYNQYLFKDYKPLQNFRINFEDFNFSKSKFLYEGPPLVKEIMFDSDFDVMDPKWYREIPVLKSQKIRC